MVITMYKLYKMYRGRSYCAHNAIMRTDRSVIMATTESAEAHPAVKDR